MNFPFWPPPEVQRPNSIVGRQAAMALQDLDVNQIPRGRSDDIQYIPYVLPRIRRPELPPSPEPKSAAAVRHTLYDLLMLTETTPPEKMLRFAAKE